MYKIEQDMEKRSRLAGSTQAKHVKGVGVDEVGNLALHELATTRQRVLMSAWIGV